MGTLGFVLGTAAMDHQQVLIDQLVDQIKNASADESFYYLVPNHIKFETEINVLAGLRDRPGQTLLFGYTLPRCLGVFGTYTR